MASAGVQESTERSFRSDSRCTACNLLPPPCGRWAKKTSAAAGDAQIRRVRREGKSAAFELAEIRPSARSATFGRSNWRRKSSRLGKQAMDASVRGISWEPPQTLRERSARMNATELVTRSESRPRRRRCCRSAETRATASRYTRNDSWSPCVSLLVRKPTSTVTLRKFRERYKAKGKSCRVASFKTKHTDRSEGRTRFPDAIASTISGHNLDFDKEHILWPTFRTREA